MIVRMRGSRRPRAATSNFLLATYLACHVMANLLPPRELVHRIEKIYVQTETEILSLEELQKREQSVCPTGHSLCPQSMNGGCCADGYGCQTDNSCSATTAGVTCLGVAGYYACGINAGAGCCPQGYICGTKCTPPAAESLSTRLCPQSYYGCPAAAGYGCCKSGMACGINTCYATTPVTHIWTVSFSTMISGKMTTLTTTQTNISTPVEPTGFPTNTKDVNAAPKFIPTAIAKLEASIIPDPDTGNGGLTSAQLGGIIGGVAGLLVIVLVVAFDILRKLRQTRRAVETSTKRGSSNPDGRTSRQAGVEPMRQFKPTPSQVAEFEYDDLLQSPDPTVSARDGAAAEFSPARTTPLASGGSSDPRHVSFNAGDGYFDYPPSRTTNRTPGTIGTVSAQGHRPSTDTAIPRTDSPGMIVSAGGYTQHGRQNSETSNWSDNGKAPDALSSGVGSPLIPAELDSAVGPMPELPTSPVWALYGDRGGDIPFYAPSRRSESTSPRRPLVAGHSRRQSGVGPSVRERSGSGASSVYSYQPQGYQPQGYQPQGQQGVTGLGVVNESVEHLHGYYGGVTFSGQTRPRDESIGQDISSPIAVAYQGRPRSRETQE